MKFKINNKQMLSLSQVELDDRIIVKKMDHTGTVKYGYTIENYEMVMLINAFLYFKEGNDVNLKDYLEEVQLWK